MSQNVLRLDNITMQFGGVVAVDNLSLEVNEGEIVALIGPNGAGKTTAFNTITGVYEPTNGQVSFMGEPIVRNHPQGKMKQNYKGKEAGKFVQLPVLDPTPDRITKLGMARTFQNIRLWKSQTVFDNVLIAKHMLRTSNVFSATFRLNRKEEAQHREEVMELLRIVGLEDVKDELATSLPYGKQRRLEIARALATHPKLLMLDEPSMGLAPILVEQIFDIIRELHAAGTTILLVEQNAQAALSVADRAYVLETGRITLSGTGKELMASDAVRKAYLGG